MIRAPRFPILTAAVAMLICCAGGAQAQTRTPAEANTQAQTRTPAEANAQAQTRTPAEANPSESAAEQRIARLLAALALPDRQMKELLRESEHVAQAFLEFQQLREYSSAARGAGDDRLPPPADFQAALGARWKAYEAALREALEGLDRLLDTDRITLIYNFLRDEMWYEGFTTARTASALPVTGSLAGAPDSTRDADISEEERRIIAMAILKAEGTRERKDTLMPRIGRKQEGSGGDAAGKPRRAESVTQVAPDPGPPPWSGMPSPPAGSESLRDLFSAQPLRALEHIWLLLRPRAERIYFKEKPGR